MKPINSLPPFKRFCVTIGNLPSSYVDSMSYYECLMWLCKYLKDTVVPAINENAEAVNELINWFNNLDVQDEIDHKLDEMAESGKLEEIVADYLNSKAVFGFNTISSMINATNLLNGSYARTLGSLTYKDGKGHFYKIRTITSGDVVDGDNIIAMNTSDTLIAEKMPDYYINTLNSKVNILDGTYRKLVMIGDSYGAGYTPDGSIPSWCNYLCNYLGLTYSEQVQTALGGTGFATDTNNFNTMATALSSDSTVTDVIVAGGYNDISKTYDNIITGITNTVATLRTKFPNAKIHIAFIGCSTIDDSKFFKNTYLAYVDGANQNKVHYLSNVEIAMHDLNTLSSDNLHPNAHGQENIGKYMAQAIINGFADVTFKEIDVNKRFHMSIHNHDLIIRCTNGGFEVNIASLACNGNVYANTLSGLTTYVKYNAIVGQTSWLTYYVSPSNRNVCVPIIFNFGKNYMILSILKNNSDNTDFDTLTSINWINVVDGEYKLEVMDC